MLNILRDALQQIVNDIDSGNTNISQEQQLQILDIINRKEMSKTEAADYIGVSPSTIDNYVKKGFIPEGMKRQGISSKLWLKSDLDKFLKNK